MDKSNPEYLINMILELAEIMKHCREETWISSDGKQGGTRNAAEELIDDFLQKYRPT